jgi:ketosteroid isomerase-like protein
MKRCEIVLGVLILGALLLVGRLGAQDEKDKKEDPVHDELRALKKQLVEAVNKKDYDTVMSYLAADVVVTWLDSRVSKGPKEVRAYLDEMTKGEKPMVVSFKIEPTVDELTHLYGKTGVAFGSSQDTFQLRDGSDFTVKSRWTATVVKEGDTWKLSALHASTNVFDNEVMALYLRWRSYLVAAVAGIGGLVLGVLIVSLFRKRSA